MEQTFCVLIIFESVMSTALFVGAYVKDLDDDHIVFYWSIFGYVNLIIYIIPSIYFQATFSLFRSVYYFYIFYLSIVTKTDILIYFIIIDIYYPLCILVQCLGWKEIHDVYSEDETTPILNV